MILIRAAEISLVCALAAGLQVSAVKPQGAASSQHLNADRFELVTSIRGLPLGIRDELQKMFGGSLDIADPGTRIESGSAATAPMRRLRAAGCARDHHCLVYYELTGGAPGWRVALFHWSPEQTRLEAGGVVAGGLTTIDDVRKAVLAGRVTAAAAW